MSAPAFATVLEALEGLYPTATWEACDELLWLTPHPCTDAKTVIAALCALREKYGPIIADAIKGEYAEMERIMRELRSSK